jgi:hypothetical protein
LWPGFPIGEDDEWAQKHHRQLPLVSLISKLFVLHYRLDSKPEVYLIIRRRHYVGEYGGQRLENAEPLEFFSCWNGDETLQVEKHRWITLEEFLAPEFYLEE